MYHTRVLKAACFFDFLTQPTFSLSRASWLTFKLKISMYNYRKLSDLLNFSRPALWNLGHDGRRSNPSFPYTDIESCWVYGFLTCL